MLTYRVKTHEYFLSEVEITIEPNEKYYRTDCEIKFIPNGQDGGLDYPSTWWVTLDEYFTDAKDALDEATKEKYMFSGTSEA